MTSSPWKDPSLLPAILKENDPIPLSYIRKKLREILDEEGGFVIEEISERITGVPVFLCAIPEQNCFSEATSMLPMTQEIIGRYEELCEIFYEIVGDPGDPEYMIRNRGDSIFPWELHVVTIENEEYYVGFVSPEGSRQEEEEDEDELNYFKNLTLFPCALVDPAK